MLVETMAVDNPQEAFVNQLLSLPPVLTLADLLEQLGDISPQRVRIQPPLGTATEQDVADIEAKENRLFELVDGVLVEKVMGFYESRIAAILVQVMGQFSEQQDHGIVIGADGMIKLRSGLVRIPDVSFLSWNQFPNRKLPSQPVPDLFPNLAVEVLSKSNTEKEMRRKIQEYFDAGAQLVWLIDPIARTADVFTAPDQQIHLGENEVLDGGMVLPGFVLPLRELFARAGKLEGS
jgi:Uma2 family endonuclease